MSWAQILQVVEVGIREQAISYPKELEGSDDSGECTDH
jgi:hypothetical protein